jgi:hypothetical protein
MKLYDIKAFTGGREVLYRNIVANTDQEARDEAARRHVRLGRLVSTTIYVISSRRVVLCPTAIPEAA